MLFITLTHRINNQWFALISSLIFLCLFSINSIHAAPFDRFLMPGEVIEGHKKYEKKCENCHLAFDKKNQNRLCLKCHKKIKKDVDDNVGFHGIEKRVINKTCNSCHTDHIGRRANIVIFDQLSFNHNNTDLKLSGVHQKIPCNSCHKKEKKFRNAPSKCIQCHEKVDVHKNRLGEKCSNCHSAKNWKNAKFDHDKTKYKLKGAHVKVLCGDCHPNQRYKATPTQCVACHKVQDIHRNEFGDKCEKCHVIKKWKNILFDHDKDTKFKLRYRHEKISCGSCHVKNAYKIKLKKTCFSCHETDDRHVGDYGEKCKKCHTDKSWRKIKFNHDKDTKYKLMGAHQRTKCVSCHMGKIDKVKLKTTCMSCHKIDDIHNGKLVKSCNYCHNQLSWNKNNTFDHDLTLFPLLGLHGLATCESCHRSTEFALDRKDCISCHKNEDEHKLRLTENCINCHNPNGWRVWTFSHDTQTDYKLTGEHKNIQCEACHREKIKKRMEIVLSDRCEACHSDDDVHSGAFGRRCDRCHITKSFKNVENL